LEYPPLRSGAFPLNQLRINGLLQSAIIAVILALNFHHTPPRAATHTWALVLGTYGLLAATVPWLNGGFLDDELEVRNAIIIGLAFALPATLAAVWLRGTPYRWIGIGYAVLVALWFLFLLVTIGRDLARGRVNAKA